MTNAADREVVIVSLTPVALSADSRTLKQATSVHRLGFRSIVIEGTKSDFAQSEVSFEVIPVRVPAGSGASNAKPVKSTDAAGGTAPSSERADGMSPVRNLSRLRQSALCRFVSRHVPGFRRLALTFESILDRTIVSRRRASRMSEQVSTGEIVAAFPSTFLRILIGVARIISRRLRNLLVAFAGPVLRFLKRTLMFAHYLVTYLHRYFISVLAVTPRADIYYLHSFYQFPAVWLLCLRYKAKMIYDAHDFYQHQKEDPTVASYWKDWVMPFEAAVERACIRFAADVVTVNEGIAAMMRERFGCEPLILRNAHDFRMDRQPSRTIREVIGLAPEAFLVVSIGNYKTGMTFEGAFDALASLPERVHLAFLGGRHPSCVEAIKARGLDGRVHFVPPVLPQEVVPFAASADAAMLVYFGRTAQYPHLLPNGFFQSIAAELPLVYPDLEQIRRLAERYNVGIMANAQDPDQIRSALLLLIEDAELRAGIRDNLRMSRRDLCWEHEEQALKGILNRHLDRSQQRVSKVEDKVAY